MIWRVVLSFAVIALLARVHAAGQEACVGGPGRHAQSVGGEVKGENDLSIRVANGLSLVLQRSSHGWRVSVLERESNDLVPAGPSGPDIKPRDIEGWHFRNADNTGPNSGEINAPQLVRRFSFVPPGETHGTTGTVALVISEFGLANLAPGQRASMVDLRFDACLTWPLAEAEVPVEPGAANLEFLPEEIEVMRACGVSEEYSLVARFPLRLLAGDLIVLEAANGSLRSLHWDGAGFVVHHHRGSRLPTQDESVVLLYVIAAKGAECGLLRPWEAANVQAMVDQETLGWEDSRSRSVEAASRNRLAETLCDASFLTAWIEGARAGMEAEYLSLHLVVYRTLLSMPAPPAWFSDTVTRTNAEADIAVISEKLTALEASGARPDGGGPWTEFVSTTSAAVERFAPLLDEGEAPPDVAFLLPRSVVIAELWLADNELD